MKKMHCPNGYTLVELLTTIAIIAILGAIAVVGYQVYVSRAQAADIVESYEAVRTNAVIGALTGAESRCEDVLQRLERKNLSQRFARMDFALEAVAGGGYRPVLTVCSRADKQGAQGVAAARNAHDMLLKTGAVEKGAVLTESVVSFALRLTPSDQVACRVPDGSGLTACGEPIAVPKFSAILTPPPLAAKPAPAPTPLPVAVPKIQAYVMKFSGSDTYVRPVGRNLNTNGDLSAFTLDMSFIGDGSIAAASGGLGPVMFNYGDATNNHNAISLWNPRSLTVAVGGSNYDTGVNVVDGKTHRITATWDGASGTLVVYDNGVVAQTFTGVAKGQTIHGGGAMVIAHKDNGGTYSAVEAFAGQVFHTSLANVAVSAAQAAKPLNQVLDAKSGLLADFRAAGGSIVDTTGRHAVETGGVTQVITGVEGNLVNPTN